MNSSLTNSITFIDNHFDLNGSITDLQKSTISLQSSTDSFTRLLETDNEYTVSNSSSNSDLTNSNMTNSNLTNSNLTNSDLTNSDLTNSDLTNSNLTNSNRLIVSKSKSRIKSNARTKYVNTYCNNLIQKVEKSWRDSYTFFSNTTSSLKQKLKDLYSSQLEKYRSKEKVLAIKEFKMRDSWSLLMKLIINRDRGNPNVYIFYKSNKVKNI